MRRLAVAASVLLVLAACSQHSSSASRETVDDVTARLLRSLPSGSNLLFVSIGGEGAGQVTSPDVTLNWLPDSTFEKSDITGAYWAYVTAGSTIRLEATAANGSTFGGWWGNACVGPGACLVTMSAYVNVGAIFGQTGGADTSQAVLSVVTTGHGAGTVTGPGISCTSGSRTGCSTTIPVVRPPQLVTLTAQPDAASLFMGWSGSCGGTGSCTVSMDSPRSAYANFAPRSLTVTVRVDGGGTVTGPSGFTCSSPAGCTFQIPNTTPAQQVVLTAAPANMFIVWSGQCASWTPSCTLVVDDDKSAIASFGALGNHQATLGSGEIEVFREGNTDHGGSFTMTEQCTLCHVANVASQHGRRCELCHAGARPAQNLIGVWNKTCSQGACHPSIHSASTGTDHFRMWQDSSTACARCHDSSGGGFPGPGDLCLRCHDPVFTINAVGDTAPPTTTTNAQALYTGGGSIHLSAVDSGGSGVSVTWYSLDGGRWNLGADVGFGAPASGTRAHSLQYYSADHAMNTEALKSLAFSVQAVVAADTTAPVTVSSLVPAAGANYRVSQGVTLTASDNASGVRATYYRIDTGAFTQGTTFTVAGDGLHTFAYYSVDIANNTETTHVSNSFRIDTVAPVTTSTVVNGGAYTGTQSFTFSASDAGSGVGSTLRNLDGAGFVAGGAVSVPAPASGTASHTLQWYSVDVAGNPETAHAATFTIAAVVAPDTTAPITIPSPNPAAGANFRAPVPVTLSATDGGSGVRSTHYRVDSGAFVQGTSFTVSGDGLHTFSYYSVDNASNTEVTRVSSSFRIDTVNPVSTCSAVAGTTYTGNQTFTLAASDTGSGVANTWYRLDGATTFTAGNSVSVAAPASGSASHTIAWYATDQAGNVEVQHTVTFTVQAQPVGGGTVTLSFRTNASFGGWSYVTWEVHDLSGNLVQDVDGNDCTWWNDDPGHPNSMWIDYVVPAGVPYVMYGAWGPMPDGPDFETATRGVSAAEAANGATVTWWWN